MLTFWYFNQIINLSSPYSHNKTLLKIWWQKLKWQKSYGTGARAHTHTHTIAKPHLPLHGGRAAELILPVKASVDEFIIQHWVSFDHQPQEAESEELHQRSTSALFLFLLRWRANARNVSFPLTLVCIPHSMSFSFHPLSLKRPRKWLQLQKRKWNEAKRKAK